MTTTVIYHCQIRISVEPRTRQAYALVLPCAEEEEQFDQRPLKNIAYTLDCEYIREE